MFFLKTAASRGRFTHPCRCLSTSGTARHFKPPPIRLTLQFQDFFCDQQRHHGIRSGEPVAPAQSRQSDPRLHRRQEHPARLQQEARRRTEAFLPPLTTSRPPGATPQRNGPINRDGSASRTATLLTILPTSSRSAIACPSTSIGSLPIYRATSLVCASKISSKQPMVFPCKHPNARRQTQSCTTRRQPATDHPTQRQIGRAHV